MNKTYLFYLLILSVLTFTNLSGATNIGGRPNNSLGYDFYVAVAPNEIESFATETIELYICSHETTTVDYYFAENKLGSFTLEPFMVKTIKLDPKQCEIRKSETPLKQMYRFVSKNWPISVYELNAKPATSDGCMILPVNAYNTEYIHNSYWENGESKYVYFKSGFIIMASEDNTECTINLKSAGNNTTGKTDKGRIAGESWKVTLLKGECYRVCTDAGTRGEYDISGTKVTSSKPIGMVSYHERAEIPRLATPNSRNHLVEMIPPTSAWGKEYYSLEFNRAAGGGDLFRVICKEPNTKVKTVWYDLKSGIILGSLDTTLALAGDFVEIVDMPSGRPAGSNVTSVKGTSKFTADKPIQVFQYAFSGAWDGSTNFDPFYITVCSTESYCNNTTFQMPSNKSFDMNYFNLLALGDTSDAINNHNLLSSIRIITKIGGKLDSEYVINRYPTFEKQRIPGTNVYWCKISHLSSGAYTIKGLTNFGGYIYGFSDVDGYGWPAAASFSNLHEKDTVAPVVTHKGDQCGNWNIHFTELSVDSLNDNPDYVRQVDLGVLEAPSLLDTSYNAKIDFPGGFYNNDVTQIDYTFKVNPIDLKNPMYAVVRIVDKAYNVSYDTVYYNPPTIEIHSKDSLNFGKKIRLGDKPIRNAYIVNKTAKQINIYGIYLSKNLNNLDTKPFTIIAGGKTLSNLNYIKLPANDSLEVQIQFNSINDNILDYDTLKVKTQCELYSSYLMSGKAIIPRISVDDVSFVKIETGTRLNSYNKVSVTNTGTDTLIITGYDLPSNSAFQVNSAATGISFPMKIVPGRNTSLTDFIIFAPMTAGKHSANLTFSHNGDHNSGDSICVLTGESFPASLVNDDKQSYFKITPNPVTGEYFTVELSNEITGSEITASIIDESGKTVINYNSVQINAGKFNLNTRGLSSGNYFLKLLVEGKEIVERVVIYK